MDKQRDKTDLLDKTPPHDLECERQLLKGLLLTDDGSASHVFAKLEPADFWDGWHRAVYAALLRAHTASIPLKGNAAVLLRYLRDTGGLKKMRGDWAAGVAKLYDGDAPVHAVHVKYFSGVLRALRRRRGAVRLSEALLQRAHDDEVTPEAWVDYADGQIKRLRDLNP